MGNPQHQKVVYHEYIVRFTYRRDFTSRDCEFRSHGFSLIDTWENEFGNIYARYCKGVKDEENTFDYIGLRYGLKYRPRNELFKESLINGNEKDYIDKRFKDITKDEYRTYLYYVLDAFKDCVGQEKLSEFVKDRPIERDKRWTK